MLPQSVSISIKYSQAAVRYSAVFFFFFSYTKTKYMQLRVLAFHNAVRSVPPRWEGTVGVNPWCDLGPVGVRDGDRGVVHPQRCNEHSQQQRLKRLACVDL